MKVNVNPTQEKIICDDCKTKFYYEFKINRDNDHIEFVNRFNATEWGEPVCPTCGLVVCDDVRSTRL